MNHPPDQFIKQTTNTQSTYVYRALCMLLSDRARQVDWDSFTQSDWELLSEIAQAEGVSPLLYSSLARQAAAGQAGVIPIPPAVNLRLAQSYYHNAAYNAMLCRELDSALAALTRASVPVILLKGAALIKTLYADPAERSMNDLDILARRDHIRPAARALQAAGFQRLMDNYIRYHVLMLGGQAGRVTLELHWSLVFNDQRFPALIDWFWDQSQPLEAGSPCVRTLSPTAHLLYLAAHLALQHEGEARLSWYYDLYLMISRFGGRMLRDSTPGDPAGDSPTDRLDWDELQQQASQAGWAQPLRQALSAAQARFGCELPDGFLDRACQQASLEAGQPVRMTGSASGRRSLSVRKAWGGLSWRDRLGVLRGLLLPRPAYLHWRYHPKPQWLWPLWYLRRWLDIIHNNSNVL